MAEGSPLEDLTELVRRMKTVRLDRLRSFFPLWTADELALAVAGATEAGSIRPTFVRDADTGCTVVAITFVRRKGG